MPACAFCQIVSRAVPAAIVFEDQLTLAFLDHRPLFPGHCLLIPKEHVETLNEIASSLLKQVSANARLLAIAMEKGMGAQGAFVAINNRVSQSVPHLHVHVVPRTKGDGLKGFFWPRQKYRDAEHLEETRALLARVMEETMQNKA
ncbi:MAG: HIT family protein [Acidobacteria bacterium]|nr:MAG: HIT family protein [Acidobacteriota bacterium]PYY19469.1 MAG: HIT family protein [Acidobacteriota bacterium]